MTASVPNIRNTCRKNTGDALGAIFFNEVLSGYHWAGSALALVGVVMFARAWRSRTG